MAELDTYYPRDLLKQTGTTLSHGVEIEILGLNEVDLMYRIVSTKDTATAEDVALIEQEVGGRNDPNIYF